MEVSFAQSQLELPVEIRFTTVGVVTHIYGMADGSWRTFSDTEKYGKLNVRCNMLENYGYFNVALQKNL